jgi:hypothetical protein
LPTAKKAFIKADSGSDRPIVPIGYEVLRNLKSGFDSRPGHMRKQVFSRSDHPLEVAPVKLPAGQPVVSPASSLADETATSRTYPVALSRS